MAGREEAGPILNGLPSQLPDIDPEAVRSELIARFPPDLSGLTKREALKHYPEKIRMALL